MARLLWNQPNQNQYEAGLDRGVLFLSNNPGLPWNGLVSVEESFIGGEATPYYFDGIKYLNLISFKSFQATITSFTAPLKFAEALGDQPVVPGFVLTRQPRLRFGFSYRTKIGDGTDYKIHIVYNALATPSALNYKTMTESVEAQTYSWKIDAVPPRSVNYRPSAHFIIDSRKVNPNTLLVLETMLYGSLTQTSYLPTIDELLNVLVLWKPFYILPNVTSGLSQLISGGSDLYETKSAGIYRTLANTRLYESTITGLYRLG